jgi:hypothetical protein
LSSTDITNEKCDHGSKVGETDLATTEHNGSVTFENGWGINLFTVTIRHRQGNSYDRQEERTYEHVQPGETVGPMAIKYTTGVGSPFDYWWIKIQAENGSTYTCKDNFYCYISSDDDGKVKLRADGASRNLYVTFSKSSGCSVSLSGVPGAAEGGDEQ